jgi:predicted alpha-1,6-mannanase (GH76 family)
MQKPKHRHITLEFFQKWSRGVLRVQSDEFPVWTSSGTVPAGLFAVIILVFLPLTASLEATVVSSSAFHARLAVERLEQWYNPKSGLWETAGWWNGANALTALIDFSRLTHSSHYLRIIANTYSTYAPIQFLKNKYYDDEGWWALAWIDAYDLTGNRDYLHTATVIFDDMATGWDDTCGGGIWWTKDRKYKNAIANELFLSVAAHLRNRATDRSREYAEWATREWVWFQSSGMIEDDHLISDGLDSHCRDNHATKWTYNQGVVLGALAELSTLPGQSAALHQAQLIATAAIQKLTDGNSILHETCEPKCGADGTQFKGIFVRNLALLELRSHSPVYTGFIAANAHSVVTNDQAPDHSFGLIWSGPPGQATAVSQASAIDALNAALAVRAKAAESGPISNHRRAE